MNQTNASSKSVIILVIDHHGNKHAAPITYQVAPTKLATAAKQRSTAEHRWLKQNSKQITCAQTKTHTTITTSIRVKKLSKVITRQSWICSSCESNNHNETPSHSPALIGALENNRKNTEISNENMPATSIENNTFREYSQHAVSRKMVKHHVQT